MQYRFTCNYRSGFGIWREGEDVEFSADTAAWLLNDVPGCIVAVEPQDAPDEAEAAARALEAPQHDRQLKKAPRSR